MTTGIERYVNYAVDASSTCVQSPDVNVCTAFYTVLKPSDYRPQVIESWLLPALAVGITDTLYTWLLGFNTSAMIV